MTYFEFIEAQCATTGRCHEDGDVPESSGVAGGVLCVAETGDRPGAFVGDAAAR